jgi:hypothetical protein
MAKHRGPQRGYRVPVIVPTFHAPGRGERHEAGGGSEIVSKATGENTAESFFMSEPTIATRISGATRTDRLQQAVIRYMPAIGRGMAR